MTSTPQPRPTVEATVALDGLYFAEAPRIGPDGALYISDFYAHEVLRIDTATWQRETIAAVPGQPSGLGWLPDGRMLIVSMRDRRLLRREHSGELVLHADLADVTAGAANDMWVDAAGRAWVGDFGFDFYGLLEREPDADPLFGPGANPPTATITRVDPNGSVHTVAKDLRFPNGTVQLSDGTLVVAETVGGCLTAFRIDDDETLTDRRLWADLSVAGIDGGQVLPDGIGLGPADHIWVSDPGAGGAVLVAEGGHVLQAVRTSQVCFAVEMIDLPQGTSVLCCTAATSNPTVAAAQRTGRLEIAPATTATKDAR
jgi:sugar lactone lactonase YvrE